jgi:hypothetical protein
MGLLSSLKNVASGGAAKMNTGYQPYKPYIRNYEALQRYDIGNLYSQKGTRAYDQKDLGYNDQEMQGLYGEGRDLNAGEAAATTQRTHDRFASPSGMGLQSAYYTRAQQREDLSRVQRANELKRRMVVENAQQKRADLLARLAAVTGAYGQGVDTYNTFATGQNSKIKQAFQASQNLFGAAGSAAAMG